MRLIACLAVVAFFVLANVVGATTFWLGAMLAAATGLAEFWWMQVALLVLAVIVALGFINGSGLIVRRLATRRAVGLVSSRPGSSTSPGRDP